MWPEGPTGLAILCFGAVYLDLAPYLARGPAAAALPHGVGQQQAVASRRQVEHSLSDDEAHPEENVTGRQKRDHQQHQAQGQRPGREGGRDAKRKRAPQQPILNYPPEHGGHTAVGTAHFS